MPVLKLYSPDREKINQANWALSEITTMLENESIYREDLDRDTVRKLMRLLSGERDSVVHVNPHARKEKP